MAPPLKAKTRALLLYIGTEPRTVGELAAFAGVTPKVMSRSLNHLSLAGKVRRNGRLWSLNKPGADLVTVRATPVPPTTRLFKGELSHRARKALCAHVGDALVTKDTKLTVAPPPPSRWGVVLPAEGGAITRDWQARVSQSHKALDTLPQSSDNR